MNKNYYIGFTRRLNGFGIMLEFDPPYSWIKKEWVFEIRILWFLFWYVKEKNIIK